MELIEREALKICKHGNGYGYCFLHEEYCPEGPCKEEELVEYAPVVHGRWEMRGGRFHCSVCDTKALWKDVGGTGGFSHEYEQATTDVCPNCGARMDGGERHEN